MGSAKPDDAAWREPLLGGDVERGAGGADEARDAAAAAGADGTGQRRPLSLLPLIALIFFEVSGGPFGTEVGCCAVWERRPVSDR